MHNRDGGLLVETELPHDPVDVVLLDVDVIKDRLSRHPIFLVSQAQGRKTARCPGVNVGCSERSPPHILVHKIVELSHEVRVRLPHLHPDPRWLQNIGNEILICTISKLGNNK